jgi:hypothetical protein
MTGVQHLCLNSDSCRDWRSPSIELLRAADGGVVVWSGEKLHDAQNGENLQSESSSANLSMANTDTCQSKIKLDNV